MHSGRALIKEDAHRAVGLGYRHLQGRLGEFEDGQSLLAGHSWKPFEEFRREPAPLTLPGTRSTAEHCVRSSMLCRLRPLDPGTGKAIIGAPASGTASFTIPLRILRRQKVRVPRARPG
jgi:hypothetical protein